MKIIHVVDDEKFSVMAKRVFDLAHPGCNSYIAFSKNIKNSTSLKVYPRFFIFLYPILKIILRADIIIFHAMSEKNILLLRSAPKKAKIIWLGWGFDYYDFLGCQLLKEKTLRLKKNKKERYNLRRLFMNFIIKVIKNKKLAWLKRVDVFSPVLSQEYHAALNAHPELKAKYASWNYGTLEDDLIRGFEGLNITGNNILLGNSASDTNNHLEAFDILKDFDVTEKRIVVPLSYGDEQYRDVIINEGRNLFGASFKPLIDFMPIDEYISILQSCSVVIMNHLRQQALGNIVIALYMGAKVFLDERNPIYAFFLEQGAFVYKLEQLDSEFEGKLSPEQVMHNREILKSYWSRDVILDKTKKLVDAALNS